MFKGEDPEKLTVADVVKRRVLLTVYNLDTKEPLYSDIGAVGQTHPAILNALHDSSDEVNDFLGKNKSKLKNMNLVRACPQRNRWKNHRASQKEITPKELRIWQAYRNKYGSFNMGRRIEQGVGNLYAPYFNGKVEEDKRVDALHLHAA